MKGRLGLIQVAFFVSQLSCKGVPTDKTYGGLYDMPLNKYSTTVRRGGMRTSMEYGLGAQWLLAEFARREEWTWSVRRGGF
jgi:hypothetical protein